MNIVQLERSLLIWACGCDFLGVFLGLSLVLNCRVVKIFLFSANKTNLLLTEDNLICFVQWASVETGRKGRCLIAIMIAIGRR